MCRLPHCRCCRHAAHRLQWDPSALHAGCTLSPGRFLVLLLGWGHTKETGNHNFQELLSAWVEHMLPNGVAQIEKTASPLVILKISGKENVTRPSPNFLQPIISLLCPNTLLSTLFWNTLSLCSSLNVWGQVSHPYKPTGKIRVRSFTF
jgi:hypothetical protein